MGGGFQVMRRIPSIKFPLRNPKSSASGSAPRSDVPAAPTNTAVGGKASLQPKRTPVTDREIEAVLVSWVAACDFQWTVEESVLTFVLPFSII
ncbi:hypothetical protein ACSBR1_026521 [Camellia fascicularis]